MLHAAYCMLHRLRHLEGRLPGAGASDLAGADYSSGSRSVRYLSRCL